MGVSKQQAAADRAAARRDAEVESEIGPTIKKLYQATTDEEVGDITIEAREAIRRRTAGPNYRPGNS